MAHDQETGIRRLALLTMLLCLMASVSNATTWYVTPAGTGDATTISGGLALANAGDRVVVGAGTYAEHDLQLGPSVELASESGAGVTIIDAGELGHGVIGADLATVRGFTIRGAGIPNAAVYCYQTSPAILDNVIEKNAGNVIVLYQSTSLIRGNTLRANLSLLPIRDPIQSSLSSPHIVQNTIEAEDKNDNAYAISIYSTGPGGAGVVIEDNMIVGRLFLDHVNGPGATEIRRNVILGREGSGGGGMNVAFCAGPLSINHNTLVHGFGIFSQGGSVFTLANNIITRMRNGISSFGGTMTLACNDFWQNQDDYGGVPPGPGDFHADPVFCNAAGGDFHIDVASPCASDHSPAGCGLVGALPPACSVTPALHTTWGKLKARYR